jgi:hypothetical protein
MAYDPVRGHVILFGGSDGFFTVYGDTWQWDGTDWTQIATTGPSARGGSAVATDDSNHVLLFGGGSPSGYQNDLWQWDGASWTQLCTSAACVAAAPPATPYMAMAFDPIRHRSVLFSYPPDPTATYGLTSEWDGTAWALTATVGPLRRQGPAMAWYPTDRRVLLFGGTTNGGDGGDDSWEYHHHGEPCATAASCENNGCVDGVCCDQTACGVCQSCATVVGAGACEPLVNVDDPDSCTGTQTCDATATCRLKNGQSCALASDCASGLCVGGVCCNRACNNDCETCTVPGAVGTCVVAPAGTASPACGAFLCNGTSVGCPTACNSSALCAAGNWCDPMSGTCSTLKPEAQACSADGQCQTGHCVDGVCCDTACLGRCHFCGSGTCTVAAGVDPRGDCSGERNCDGACDATGACVFPGAETSCDTCKVCNQSGRCNEPPRDGDDPACGASIDCAALSTECRSFADLTSHRCAGVGLCATPNDPATCTVASDALDGTPCSGGACQRGQCVAAPPVKSKPSSGGCALAGRGAHGGAWLAFLWLLGRRRRRGAPRAGGHRLVFR